MVAWGDSKRPLTLARRDATDPAPRLEATPSLASARASRQANVNKQGRSKLKRMVVVVVVALAWIGGSAHAATAGRQIGPGDGGLGCSASNYLQIVYWPNGKFICAWGGSAYEWVQIG